MGPKLFVLSSEVSLILWTSLREFPLYTAFTLHFKRKRRCIYDMYLLYIAMHTFLQCCCRYCVQYSVYSRNCSMFCIKVHHKKVLLMPTNPIHYRPITFIAPISTLGGVTEVSYLCAVRKQLN